MRLKAMRGAGVVGLALVLAPGSNAAGQTDVHFDNPTCATCSIVATKTVTVRTDGSPVSLTEYTKLVRARSGEIIAAPTAEGPLAVFTSEGSFHRTIGSGGTAKGQFSTDPNLEAIPLGDGGVLVLDPGNMRASWLDAEDSVVAERTIPRALDYLSLGGDTIAFARNYRTHELIGLPVHIATNGGMRSFGTDADLTVHSSDSPWDLERMLGTTRDSDTFLVHHLNAYVVEIYNRNGEFVRTLVRNVEWFQHHDGKADAEGKPKPWFVYAREVPEGILCIVWVASDVWSKYAPKGEEVSSIEEWNGLKDSVVELLDRAEGRLTARARVGMPLRGWVDDSTAYSFRQEGAMGRVSADLWTVRAVASGK